MRRIEPPGSVELAEPGASSADLLEAIELSDGHKVLIFPDTEAESPREWDNLGSMMCAHGKYKLGDEDQEVFEDAESWQDNLEMIKEQLGEQIISLPLYSSWGSGVESPRIYPWDAEPQ